MCMLVSITCMAWFSSQWNAATPKALNPFTMIWTCCTLDKQEKLLDQRRKTRTFN